MAARRTQPTAAPTSGGRARGRTGSQSQPLPDYTGQAPTATHDALGNPLDPETVATNQAASQAIAETPQPNGLTVDSQIFQNNLGNQSRDVGGQILDDRDRITGQQPAATTGQFGTGAGRPSLNQILTNTPKTPGAALDTTSRFGAPGAPAQTSQFLAPIAQEADANIDMHRTMDAPPSKAETAANQAKDALGPTPQMDMGIADRQLGAYQEALGMSREVLDRLLNGPSVADKVGARALENQLAVARSARGGPGAVQDALNAAQQQAPQLQAQASQQAVSEENARLAQAGNVASNFAQAALGARGQDVQIASENTRAATSMVGEINKLAGVQLQLDQQNEQFMGQMARDWAQLDFDFSKMAVDQQEAWFDRQVQMYGIDQQVAAQMKAIAAQEGIGPADWFNGIVGVLGGGATLGAAAIKG